MEKLSFNHYRDPKGYWGDVHGNIRRLSGEQEIIATVTSDCSEAEWKALCRIAPAGDALLAKVLRFYNRRPT